MHCREGCLQVRTTGPAVRKRAIYGANQRARTSSRSSSLPGYVSLGTEATESFRSPKMAGPRLCWWLPRKAANVTAAFIVISIYLRSLAGGDHTPQSKNLKTRAP